MSNAAKPHANEHRGKPEVVTLSIGIGFFLISDAPFPQNPTSSQRDMYLFDFPLSKIFRLLGFLQRDLQFLISRCHKSSVGTVFHSGIYIFLFPAVKIPLLAWYSTARFTIFDFPLFQAFFLPDFAKGATSINLDFSSLATSPSPDF